MEAASYHGRGRDRLSELPDSLILEKILPLLKIKYVVRTTILSKRWKDLWTDISCLDFCSSSPTFVEGALAKWEGAKILKFRVHYIIDSSWLLIPLLKHVEDLHVSFDPDRVGVNLLATRRLFSCSSITKLTLFNCDLNIGENVKVQWNQLKSLTIANPINVTQGVMNRILSGAPLLEELILLGLKIAEYIRIQSSSLKTLEINNDDWQTGESTEVMAEGVLRICAPNLLTLYFSACVYGTCLLYVPSLTSAVIRFHEDFPPLEMFAQFFKSLRHVEKLTLPDLSIEFLLVMKKSDIVVLPFNTKYLKLTGYKTKEMLDVLGMFPALKNLVVDFNKYDYDDCSSDEDAYNSSASEMAFPIPSLLHLKTVEMIDCSFYVASKIRMVEILLENAHVLEKMVLRLFATRADEEIFMMAKKKVLSMPRSSPTAQVIISK